jgi:hypothetical protein
MSDSWNITAGGRSYGPYTLEDMQRFVADGRLAAHSQVERTGEQNACAARDDPELAAFFASTKKGTGPAPSATGRFFTAKRSDEESNTPSFGRSTEDIQASERGRFLIIADMKSRSISGLEEEILNLGPAYALLPQIWLLVSDKSINAIRNALLQKLGKIDTLFVVDATRNKATWFNFGPEAEARIRRVWSDQQVDVEKIADKR